MGNWISDPSILKNMSSAEIMENASVASEGQDMEELARQELLSMGLAPETFGKIIQVFQKITKPGKAPDSEEQRQDVDDDTPKGEC